MTYVKQAGHKEVSDKALTTNWVKESGKIKKDHKKQTNWRWTEVENRYSSVKGRLFDKIPPARNSEFDHDPLYSSFTKDKVFKAPMSSKDAIQK
jgi:hypothetical protein